MNGKQYKRVRGRDVEGRRVRLGRDVANKAGCRFEEGATVTITRKFGGFDITGHCSRHTRGTLCRVSRVGFDAVQSWEGL